jgi:predicted esterase
MSLTRIGAAVLLTLLVSSSRRCASQQPPGVTGASRPSAAPADEELNAVSARIHARIERLLARAQPELYRTHLQSVLALLQADRLKLRFAGDKHVEQSNELLGYLRAIEAGLNDDTDRAGPFLVDGKRALVIARQSRTDGTLQFYLMSLPPKWDRRRAYPLHVQLHGNGPSLPTAYVSFVVGPHQQYETRGERIAIGPWMRGNVSYQPGNVSEADVFEAIDYVRTIATIDPDRVHLSGHSGGGDYVWGMTQRTPDRWAAAAILAGNPRGAPEQLGLVPNVRNLPFYVWVGEKDPIVNRRPFFEQFGRMLRAVGNEPTMVIGEGAPHMYRPQDAQAVQEWLLQRVRRRPTHFAFIADTPYHRGVWGISVPRTYPGSYLLPEPRASFECWIEGQTVRIETRDATRLDVDLGANGLRLSGDVTVTVNGTPRFAGPVPERALSLIL